MFIDLLSWLATQVLILALVIFGFSIYENDIRKSKIENAKKMKRYKNNIIREISPDDKGKMICVVRPHIPKEMQIRKKDTTGDIGSRFSVCEIFKTLKYDNTDIIFKGNLEFAHYGGGFQMQIINKENKEYNNIVNYLKGNCEFNLDECIIYQSRQIASTLRVVTNKESGKITCNKVHFTLDSVVSELIPDRTHFCSSSITIIICSIIKGLIYCFS